VTSGGPLKEEEAFLPLHCFDDGERVRLDIVVEHHLDGQGELKRGFLTRCGCGVQIVKN
jgi:hypothetical protein